MDETYGFSMADLDLLVRAAALAALRESVAGAGGGAEVRVSEAHVRAARAAVVGSLSDAPERRPRTWARRGRSQPAGLSRCRERPARVALHQSGGRLSARGGRPARRKAVYLNFLRL